MNRWRNVWAAIRDPTRIGRLLQQEQENNLYARETYSRLKREGFVSNLWGNPAAKIGSALQLARRWRLILTKGTCCGDCQAILHENCWLQPINRNVPSWAYGTFALQEPEDIHEIYAFGSSVQEAVCKCLLNAREAGVI